MNLQRSHQGAAALLVTVCGSAAAGPTLLATYRKDASAGGGSAPITELATHFALQLPTSPPFGPPVDPNVGVGVGVVWQNGQTGAAEFTSLTDSYFDSFAQHATDGVDDWIGIYTPWGGFLQRESEVFGHTPDLGGFELDSVRLIVHDLSFEPLPKLDGSEIFWDVTYEFYGTPVPEPTALGYFVTGLLLVSHTKR